MRSIEDAIDAAVAQGAQTSAQIVAIARRFLENAEPEATHPPDDLRFNQEENEDEA
jgi:hypothetical protein